MGGIAVGILDGGSTSNAVVLGRTDAADRIGGGNQLTVPIISIAPGIAAGIGHGNNTAISIVGIAGDRSVGICCCGQISAVIIGIAGHIAQRIGDRGHVVLRVTGKGGDMAHAVAFADVEAVAIHRVGLLAAIGADDLHQFAGLGIFIGSD